MAAAAGSELRHGGRKLARPLAAAVSSEVARGQPAPKWPFRRLRGCFAGQACRVVAVGYFVRLLKPLKKLHICSCLEVVHTWFYKHRRALIIKACALQSGQQYKHGQTTH